MTACLILYTRSAGVLYFAIGAVFCSLSVKVVKKIIRQPRPTPINTPGRKSKATYGYVEARVFYRSGVIIDHEYILLLQHAEYSLCCSRPLRDVHLPRMSISSYPSNTSIWPIRSHTSTTHRISLCSDDRLVKIVAWTSYYAPSCCRCLIWCCFCVRVVHSMDKRVKWMGCACRGHFQFGKIKIIIILVLF